MGCWVTRGGGGGGKEGGQTYTRSHRLERMMLRGSCSWLLPSCRTHAGRPELGGRGVLVAFLLVFLQRSSYRIARKFFPCERRGEKKGLSGISSRYFPTFSPPPPFFPEKLCRRRNRERDRAAASTPIRSAFVPGKLLWVQILFFPPSTNFALGNRWWKYE